MTILEEVGVKIREMRKNYNGGLGLSQEELAEKLDVKTNTISRWETATYKPSIEDLDKLARIFNVSILEFFPAEQNQDQADDQIRALLRAAKELPQKDIEELKRYAEFRRARYIMEGKGRPQPGRRPKRKQ